MKLIQVIWVVLIVMISLVPGVHETGQEVDTLRVEVVYTCTSYYLAKEHFRSMYANVTHLTLVNCSLNSVHPQAFKGLVNLVVLNAPYNDITYLPNRVFTYTPQLRIVDLTDNINMLIKPNEPFLISNSIHSLYMRHCGLNTENYSDKTFSRLPRLRYVDVEDRICSLLNAAVKHPKCVGEQEVKSAAVVPPATQPTSSGENKSGKKQGANSTVSPAVNVTAEPTSSGENRNKTVVIKNSGSGLPGLQIAGIICGFIIIVIIITISIIWCFYRAAWDNFWRHI